MERKIVCEGDEHRYLTFRTKLQEQETWHFIFPIVNPDIFQLPTMSLLDSNDDRITRVTASSFSILSLKTLSGALTPCMGGHHKYFVPRYWLEILAYFALVDQSLIIASLFSLLLPYSIHKITFPANHKDQSFLHTTHTESARTLTINRILRTALWSFHSSAYDAGGSTCMATRCVFRVGLSSFTNINDTPPLLLSPEALLGRKICQRNKTEETATITSTAGAEELKLSETLRRCRFSD